MQCYLQISADKSTRCRALKIARHPSGHAICHPQVGTGVESLVQFKDVYRKFKHAANLLIDTTGAPSEALSSGQATSQSGGTAGGGGAAARPDLSTVNSRGIRSSSLVLRPTEDTHLNRFLSKTRSALRRKGKILHRMLVGRWGWLLAADIYLAYHYNGATSTWY